METSRFIAQAFQCLNLAKNREFTAQERRETAINLAGAMLAEAKRIQTPSEKEFQEELARMMNDDLGKVFISKMTDQCFRSQESSRVADQLDYLIDKYGIPRFFSSWKQLQMKLFRIFGKFFSTIAIPIVKHTIRQSTSKVILPGESQALVSHMQKRRLEDVKINLNHLGEAVLGEEEALIRLQTYLEDLANPEIEYISVKVSTIYSQINLLAWEKTLEVLGERLKQLYRQAQNHFFMSPDGKKTAKFVNLDMEEYKDLHLTVELFQRVLEDSEFYDYSAGIVLQSYLPDSYLIQKQLTIWALQRVSNGAAPIKIRIVKGANLAMEKVEASLRGWEQAPYLSKEEVDANFKRMVLYGSETEHAKAAHLGIASHNLFDIAYAMLIRIEKKS